MTEAIASRRIDGRAKTVKELLDGARYTIDVYDSRRALYRLARCSGEPNDL